MNIAAAEELFRQTHFNACKVLEDYGEEHPHNGVITFDFPFGDYRVYLDDQLTFCHKVFKDDSRVDQENVRLILSLTGNVRNLADRAAREQLLQVKRDYLKMGESVIRATIRGSTHSPYVSFHRSVFEPPTNSAAEAAINALAVAEFTADIANIHSINRKRTITVPADPDFEVIQRAVDALANAKST